MTDATTTMVGLIADLKKEKDKRIAELEAERDRLETRNKKQAVMIQDLWDERYKLREALGRIALGVCHECMRAAIARVALNKADTPTPQEAEK